MPKATDFYDNETDTEMPDKMMGGDGGEKDMAIEDSESPVEVVSKSFFMGKTPKPGDTCEVKVTRTDGNSVLIEYVRDMSKGGEGGEGGDEEGPGDETMGPEEKGEGLYD